MAHQELEVQTLGAEGHLSDSSEHGKDGSLQLGIFASL